jgi:starch synthase
LLPADAQLVLCASSPDEAGIAAEMAAGVSTLQATHKNVVWVDRQLPRTELISVMSSATVFVCPSVYEPLGIVNLEAMACGTAVVASDVGGIPEVVLHGETGLLVEYGASDLSTFERDLGRSIGALLDDPARAARMGEAGRQRAVQDFGWDQIAGRTVDVYREAIARQRR